MLFSLLADACSRRRYTVLPEPIRPTITRARRSSARVANALIPSSPAKSTNCSRRLSRLSRAPSGLPKGAAPVLSTEDDVRMFIAVAARPPGSRTPYLAGATIFPAKYIPPAAGGAEVPWTGRHERSPAPAEAHHRHRVGTRVLLD